MRRSHAENKARDLRFPLHGLGLENPSQNMYFTFGIKTFFINGLILCHIFSIHTSWPLIKSFHAQFYYSHKQ